MWLITKLGFFSIVKKEDGFNVRARARGDLAALNEAAGTNYEIHKRERSDYTYRFVLTPAEMPPIWEAISSSVDYMNFKGTISKDPRQNNRTDTYFAVWSTLAHDLPKLAKPKPTSPSLAASD